nr:reverse transcriptase domain-containing protein [Tanacetum cinerariifolium]
MSPIRNNRANKNKAIVASSSSDYSPTEATVNEPRSQQAVASDSTYSEFVTHAICLIWRMCVNFKDLNKACLKDGYPLSEVDWKVESLCGYPFKYFLDAYKGYHQIKMAEDDEEKTVFITSQEIFCYSKMPFGLKYAGASYQRLVDKAFQKQIGRNLKVYVDDLVIKSRTEKEVIRDIEETFKTLRPKTSVKGQILADFITERLEDDTLDTPIEDPEERPDPWVLFTDGSSCINGSGAGLIITNPEGMEFTYALRFRSNATNNEAEYEVLIAGLQIAEQMGVKNLQENIDSKLVANQRRKQKSRRAKQDSIYQFCPPKRGRTHLDDSNNEYLTKEVLPEEKRKTRVIRRKAGRYAVSNEILYKKSFLGPWLRCVGPLQANYVLREIHEGSCSMHTGPRSVVAKVLRSGYYWPTMHSDARNLIRECSSCQVHREVPRNPQLKLTPITSPWPFHIWGIDIARPFPKGLGKVKFLIVALDYFTKWIEAELVATITGA